MFTGLIEEIGHIIAASEQSGQLRIEIRADKVTHGLAVGDSIAVSGVCLTVITMEQRGFSVELAQETRSRSASRWRKGVRVNLERAIRADARMGGHFVSGHVDGIGLVRELRIAPGAHDLSISTPPQLSRYIAEKGSITIDGVSLTVAGKDAQTFWVTLIPHTLAHTTLENLKPDDMVNLEVDLIARYLEQLLEAHHA